MTRDDSHATKEDSGDTPRLPIMDSRAYTNEEYLVADIIEAMKSQGACIVQNMFDSAVVEQVMKDVQPHVVKAGNYTGCSGQNSVISALLSKSDTFALDIVGHKLFHDVIDHFLTDHLRPCSVAGDLEASGSCKPQLDATFCIYSPPGGKAQGLHRDSIDRLRWLPAVKEYTLGRDIGVTMLTALTKSTRENGATLVIPGSHLWSSDHPHLDPNDESIVYAELNPGDSLLLLSSVVHAGGENKSSAENRVVAACFASRSHLKQLENQYLAHDMEKVKQFPVWLQRFMGYSLTQPYCGWVDMKDPLRVINPHAEVFLDGWNIDMNPVGGRDRGQKDPDI